MIPTSVSTFQAGFPERSEAAGLLSSDDISAAVSLGQRQEQLLRLTDLRARLVIDSWTRSDAFKLRHLCYHSGGYIDLKPHAEFSDEYDFDASSQTVVLYNGVEPIGSVRVCCTLRHEKPRLPLAATFPEEFGRLLEMHEQAVEINRLVCHPSYSQNQSVVFTLIRMADWLIRQKNPDVIAICVRANHVGFWKRLRFEYLAGPRTYSGLNFSTNLLGLKRERCELVRRVVPMLRVNADDSASYERLFQSETVSVFGHV